MTVLLNSEVLGIPCRRGKVRDVYDLGDRLVLVATDRISAFDVVLPTGIPDKGKVLTALTLFWLEMLGVENHLLTTIPPSGFEALAGRLCVVRKARVVPIECVVRGYLAGSGWKEYCAAGNVCGVPLPPGLREASRLPQPIFTPATKEEEGHDENISFERMSEFIGQSLAEDLRERTRSLYNKAASHALARGIILADTKLEWGIMPDGRVLLIDEVLTPDSSRFWPMVDYREGTNPPSFDKQYVRDWLSANWDKTGAPPPLPDEVVARTRAKYVEAFERLTGRPFAG
ncbi:MAG: phosphoribosylaminoimidazolesuccinocarboxamide synthase [Planctomycetia bacterium]|nr:phosphoribosylaminoimidazolesuccinocarboxamide synthase [Planctomycetia bacterium]